LLTSPKQIDVYSLPEEGMTALVLNRFGEAAVAKLIIKSLKETPLTKIEIGKQHL
jgi:hypothetical protein